MTSSENSRIAKNTLLLYVRMLIVMSINMWTVRLVFKALGVIDYGIYDVVAGIIAMISSISSVLSSSAQRFFSYYLGTKDYDKLQKIYTVCINIFFVFSMVTFAFGESIGIWFINSHLTIPYERITVANWVFHFSLLSLVFLLLHTPFSAAVIAQEDMGVFASVSLSECVLKFFLALCMMYTTYDRLMIYSAGLMLISFVSLIIYIYIVCHRYSVYKYIRGAKGNGMYKEVLSFSGWIFGASVAGLSMNQLTTILVNIFFGPVVNAARAVSMQINNVLNSFCGSFTMAIRPPMIKAYSHEDYKYLNMVFSMSNKFIFYLLMMISIPLYMEMETVLNIWLNTNDSQTILFSRLILIYSFLLLLNNPISFIIHATGHVREYHLVVEIPTILCAPFTYIAFKMGAPAYASYIVLIGCVVVSHGLRIKSIMRWYKYFELGVYLKSFLLPALAISLVTIFVVGVVNNLINIIWLRVVVTILLSVFLLCGMGYLLGTTQSERFFIKTFVKTIITKVKNHGKSK